MGITLTQNMIKKLLYFLLPLFITACQKELYFPNEPGGSGIAVFTFSGTGATCTGAVVNGDYITGENSDNTNTVEITVNVTQTGIYNFSTSKLNGVTFYATGAFTTTGDHKILLYGNGTPVEAGSFIFKTGTNGCSFTINFKSPVTNPSAAIFTYDGAPGGCTGAETSGNFIVGTALTALNTAIVTVDVTVPGTYSINTGTVNGISFSATGSFATTGVKTVILTGTGTPAAAGLFNFTAGTGGCTFSVNCINETTETVYFYEATIDGVNYRQEVTKTNNFKVISANSVSGDNYAFATQLDYKSLPRPAGTTYFFLQKDYFKNFSLSDATQFKDFFAPGTYPIIDKLGDEGILFNWGDNDKEWISLDVANSTPQTGSNFTITKVEEAPLLKPGYWVNVYGTFNCKLFDAAGNVKTVTDGKFCIPIYYK